MTALDFNAMPVETIADLKGRVDIVDFVGRYVKLKRAGADYGGAMSFPHRAHAQLSRSARGGRTSSAGAAALPVT